MAADSELIKRAEDLLRRCKERSVLTHSLFLTPADQYLFEAHFRHRADARIMFSGGIQNAERKIAFFLPEWYPDEDPSQECICAVEIVPGFGRPGHRDYLGSILALGLKRDWVGDIIINDEKTYVLCIDSVKDSIVLDLDHVGRFGVKRREVSLAEVPPIIINTKEISFTVQSPRLDTVTGSMFGISRTQTAKYISEGIVSLNYSICYDSDQLVKPGDVISLKGKGKGVISEQGGISRKGRTYYTAEIYK